MYSYFIYLLEISLVFTFLFSIYRLMLSKHTFHNLNRFVLVMIIPVSIIIPFIKSKYSFQVIPTNIPVFNEMHSESLNVSNNTKAIDFFQINYIQILYFIYVLGIFFSFFKIGKAIIHLYKLRRKASIQYSGKYQLVYCKTLETFSYFRWIFVPTGSADKIIIDHEKKHADFYHTLDRLLTELFIAFFWFNPIVYLFRKSLTSVHEFQVDSKVLKDKNINISDYLQLLLDTINSNHNKKLYSYFNQPMIKNRVEMICKTKTKKFLRLKYLVLVPVCLICLLSFTKKEFSIPVTNNVVTVKETKQPIRFSYPIKKSKKPYITSHFGHRIHPISKSKQYHNGIDFRAKVNTPIVASSDGVVTNASLEGKWGNLIIIKHSDGYETLYAHLNKFNCKKNQIVKKGEIIGYTGKTGLIKGPHLHFAIKHNDEYVNPIDYLN